MECVWYMMGAQSVVAIIIIKTINASLCELL